MTDRPLLPREAPISRLHQRRPHHEGYVALPTRQMDIGVYGARAIPSTYSGYETFLTTLLPQLAARGHDVTMYCRATEDTGSTPYHGVKRVVLPAVTGKAFNTLSHGAVAAAYARLKRHDVVLVVNVANAVFCAGSRLTGQRVVLNTDGMEWLRGKWGRVARAYFHASARMAKHAATALVSDCPQMADIYLREFDAPSTIIPYCAPQIDVANDDATLSQYGVMPDGYHLIAARWNPENNVDRIAAAYADSETALPLLVLGAANYDSPVRRRLMAIAQRCPRVRLVGHVSDRTTFLTLVGRARSYLHGHSVGGMNPALVEAMHAGALVLAYDTTFNRETLGESGLYFSLDDGCIEAALRTVESFDHEEANALRTSAHIRAATRFSVDAVVGAYEELLSATLERSSWARNVIPTIWDADASS
jgi:glycosyltransferase involved in cell wall biosynthesis